MYLPTHYAALFALILLLEFGALFVYTIIGLLKSNPLPYLLPGPSLPLCQSVNTAAPLTNIIPNADNGNSNQQGLSQGYPQDGPLALTMHTVSVTTTSISTATVTSVSTTTTTLIQKMPDVAQLTSVLAALKPTASTTSLTSTISATASATSVSEAEETEAPDNEGRSVVTVQSTKVIETTLRPESVRPSETVLVTSFVDATPTPA